MHLIRVPSVRSLATIWPNTRLCCEWGYYEIHTTLSCPSWILGVFLGFPALDFPLFSAVQGRLSLASDFWIQSLTSSP